MVKMVTAVMANPVVAVVAVVLMVMAELLAVKLRSLVAASWSLLPPLLWESQAALCALPASQHPVRDQAQWLAA